MAEWKKLEYQDGMWPDPIIDEIRNAKHGFILRFEDGSESDIYTSHTILGDLDDVTDYLICEPNKHKDMIIRWAQTGQPVFYASKNEIIRFSSNPNWNTNLDYMFDPYRKVVKYRDYIAKDSANNHFKCTLNDKDKETPEYIENRLSFVRWIHNDWQELEID